MTDPTHKQQIKTACCDDCGEPVAYKVNKNGLVYFYCGEKGCFGKRTFGRAKSERLIAEFKDREARSAEISSAERAARRSERDKAARADAAPAPKVTLPTMEDSDDDGRNFLGL